MCLDDPTRPSDGELAPEATILSLYYPVTVLPDGDFLVAAPRSVEQARNLAHYVIAAERIATLGRDLLREWEARQ
jgi:hypothetical protein